jgi:hypothetical protein
MSNLQIEFYRSRAHCRMADEKSIVPRYLYLIFDLRMTIYAIVRTGERFDADATLELLACQ